MSFPDRRYLSMSRAESTSVTVVLGAVWTSTLRLIILVFCTFMHPFSSGYWLTLSIAGKLFRTTLNHLPKLHLSATDCAVETRLTTFFQLFLPVSDSFTQAVQKRLSGFLMSDSRPELCDCKSDRSGQNSEKHLIPDPPPPPDKPCAAMGKYSAPPHRNMTRGASPWNQHSYQKPCLPCFFLSSNNPGCAYYQNIMRVCLGHARKYIGMPRSPLPWGWDRRQNSTSDLNLHPLSDELVRRNFRSLQPSTCELI